MDFNLKKLANDASGLFSRAKQYTEETFLKAEKTELDPHFEQLLQRADKTEEHTKKLLNCIESYLQPNPTVRMEDVFYEKLELKKESHRDNNLEALGKAMLDAGHEFGATSLYGSALLKIAKTETAIGQRESEFINTAATNCLLPIRRFLEGDMRTIQRERKVLHGKRLDLDASKSKLKKAKTLEASAVAEADLRVAQSEFDKQCEITKLLLEGIQTAHNNQSKCIRDFVDAQTSFYASAHQQMVDLQRELSSPGSDIEIELIPNGSEDSLKSYNSSNSSKTRQARALMDYAPLDNSEIELKANEVVIMYSLPGMDTDYVMVEKMGKRGKVPLTFLQEI
ncbi:unnamed protein product [Bursaphelenchus okinawaensis]|uniref:Endophilin-B1 n=1 Tax=Bursaphelenchus okinawaensis TaxID=465554 RepID=A0A811LMP0_9BILA|nr:unnamed protein product [Bursaphelenchus okinawaensis]CAG9127224.1 unnamed protein product [Bursaphelenchus okinawaensis]